ncbi:putative 2-heptaprenyl-1,4-naphthoquinone methyltransferase [Talaromyces proteolyticus]|uniref:2-heptaprenyl-1,4-naphthoquinone methyltransferase n=1 Tax=Talaromyces proteolyticus TaxID=1131652 RepID=A0AAD4L053_9EURO|nr:putative 2-heptaprenyl-1,4-naphthoquinone methyltransferase [Talaromyces proteolyticus]KAH8703799.1 putative 2-heptaprenyl-1,4-naphthoquinone methyltransferase [Talaromyces proteolyticus]
MTTQALPNAAQTGFSNASAYDKHRPTYTTQETETLLSSIGLKDHKGAKLLDLAAGTGLFTEALAARHEDFVITAIEPHDDMREELEKKDLQRVTVKKGRANDIPLEDGSVDAVFAAQAFHWFANVESLKEIRRVLKPNGVLGLIWHVDDWNAYKSNIPTTKWEIVIKEEIWHHDDSLPRYRHGLWKAVFDEQNQVYFKSPIEEKSDPFTYYMTLEALWSRLQTFSQFANLGEEDFKKLKERFDDALSGEDVPRNEAGDVAVHGKTQYAWAKAV